MPRDDSPRFDPASQGIYHHLLVTADGICHIHFTNWSIAIAEGQAVGTCTRCGGLLTGRAGRKYGRVTWYEAVCVLIEDEDGERVTGCGHEYALPNGQVLKFSSRHDQMPAGWWEKRIEALAKAGD